MHKLLLSQRTKKINIIGPCGDLEALLSIPEKILGVAVVCHPHPQHGGTMHNKVVTTLTKSLDILNYITIRFNYRGVGKSVGSYANGIGEVEDLLAVYSWIQNNYPNLACILAGFSFGSYICLHASLTINPKAVITVAPAIFRQDYRSCENYSGTWWLIQGGNDELTEADKVYSWAEDLACKNNIIKIDKASHFFHGCLNILEEKIITIIGKDWNST